MSYLYVWDGTVDFVRIPNNNQNLVAVALYGTVGLAGHLGDVRAYVYDTTETDTIINTAVVSTATNCLSVCLNETLDGKLFCSYLRNGDLYIAISLDGGYTWTESLVQTGPYRIAIARMDLLNSQLLIALDPDFLPSSMPSGTYTQYIVGSVQASGSIVFTTPIVMGLYSSTSGLDGDQLSDIIQMPDGTWLAFWTGKSTGVNHFSTFYSFGKGLLSSGVSWDTHTDPSTNPSPGTSYSLIGNTGYLLGGSSTISSHLLIAFPSGVSGKPPPSVSPINSTRYKIKRRIDGVWEILYLTQPLIGGSYYETQPVFERCSNLRTNAMSSAIWTSP